MSRQNAVRSGLVGVFVGASALLAQGQPDDAEWIERQRAANAALRAELQRIDARLKQLEGQQTPEARAAGVAPLSSERGAASHEELAARLVSSWRTAPPRGASWSPDPLLRTFDRATGLLAPEQAAQIAAAHLPPCSAAELDAVEQELVWYLSQSRLVGITAPPPPGPFVPTLEALGLVLIGQEESDRCEVRRTVAGFPASRHPFAYGDRIEALEAGGRLVRVDTRAELERALRDLAGHPQVVFHGRGGRGMFADACPLRDPAWKVALVRMNLLIQTRIECTLQLTLLERAGRWYLVRLTAPWLVDNARRALAVARKSDQLALGFGGELDTLGVVHGPTPPFRDSTAVQLPGYRLEKSKELGLVATPRLPGLPLLTDDREPSLAVRLRETTDPQARVDLLLSLIESGPGDDGLRAELARARLAVARRAVLTDPTRDLVPALGAILSELPDPPGLSGAPSIKAMRTRLLVAAGDLDGARQAIQTDPQLWRWHEQSGYTDGWITLQRTRLGLTVGDHNRALITAATVASAAREGGDRALEAEALAIQSEVYWSLGQLDQAQRSLDAALTADPATSPAQALRVLLALERAEPLTPELLQAAQLARRLDRWEPLAYLASVRAALARGELLEAERALSTSTMTAEYLRVMQARAELDLAQGKTLQRHPLAACSKREWCLALAESSLHSGDVAAVCSRVAEADASPGEPTPRQRAWQERLEERASARTDAAGLVERWSASLFALEGVHAVMHDEHGVQVYVDGAAEARLRASEALRGLQRHARASGVAVKVIPAEHRDD